MIVGLVLENVWAGQARSNGGPEGGAAGVLVLFALGGAIMGKLVGRVRAHEKLKQSIRDIQAQW
jgi:hypothetical protein